jgi:hypothetical protein
MEIEQKNKTGRLLTVAQFAQEHRAFSQPALRHLIFDAQANGFSKVIKRIGKRKILLDEQAFFDWVSEQNNGGQDES